MSSHLARLPNSQYLVNAYAHTECIIITILLSLLLCLIIHILLSSGSQFCLFLPFLLLFYHLLTVCLWTRDLKTTLSLHLVDLQKLLIIESKSSSISFSVLCDAMIIRKQIGWPTERIGLTRVQDYYCCSWCSCFCHIHFEWWCMTSILAKYCQNGIADFGV